MENRIRYNGIIATHPGSYIEDFLEDTGTTTEELSKQSNIEFEKLKKFINAEIDVDDEITEKLYPVTGFTPKMLLGFQDLYYKELEQIEELKIKVKSKLFSVARYIVKVFKKISTLKLQKMLYYCNAFSLVLLSRPLFDENFQAWANGPVVPDFFDFHEGKHFIYIRDFCDMKPPRLYKKEKEVIDLVIQKFAKYTGQELSDLTHQQRPWIEARENLPEGERCKNIISKDVMQDYFGGISKKFIPKKLNNKPLELVQD